MFTTWMPQVDNADTAVKKATGKLVISPVCVANGSSSSAVAITIRAMKYMMDSRPGWLNRWSVRLTLRMRLAGELLLDLPVRSLDRVILKRCSASTGSSRSRATEPS